MKSRILQGVWRQAGGRSGHAWSQNHWVISHRLGQPGPALEDGGWVAAMTIDGLPAVASRPARAAARRTP